MSSPTIPLFRGIFSRSSASITPLLLRGMSLPSSAFATLLRRECHHEVQQFACLGKCRHEVPLPQLCSGGNDMSKFRSRNLAQKGRSPEVLLPQSRCWAKILYKLLQLSSECNVMSEFCFRTSAQMGMFSWSSGSEIPPSDNVFTKFRFHNSALGVMTCRSSAPAT